MKSGLHFKKMGHTEKAFHTSTQEKNGHSWKSVKQIINFTMFSGMYFPGAFIILIFNSIEKVEEHVTL